MKLPLPPSKLSKVMIVSLFRQNCLPVCCLLMIILGDKNDNPPADATWLDNPYAWLRDK